MKSDLSWNDHIQSIGCFLPLFADRISSGTFPSVSQVEFWTVKLESPSPLISMPYWVRAEMSKRFFISMKNCVQMESFSWKHLIISHGRSTSSIAAERQNHFQGPVENLSYILPSIIVARIFCVKEFNRSTGITRWTRPCPSVSTTSFACFHSSSILSYSAQFEAFEINLKVSLFSCEEIRLRPKHGKCLRKVIYIFLKIGKFTTLRFRVCWFWKADLGVPLWTAQCFKSHSFKLGNFIHCSAVTILLQVSENIKKLSIGDHVLKRK
jgi:hypothetical protein